MFLLRFFVCFLLAVSLARGQKSNNVCPTFEDYETMEHNKRCWHNPDVNAKPESIARRYGFNLETHEVVTEDGYILNLNRLVPLTGKAGTLPVLIHHGICANAGLWLIHGETSLPFYLASIGYDVWLSNARGTEPSMRHVRMSIADPAFWDFSFHEMGILDAPATLEYIRKKRGDGKKVTFIGHSMGGTLQYVYASMMPDHAKKNVMALISIAPVVYTTHLVAPAAKLSAPFTSTIRKELSMLEFYGSGLFPQLKKTVGNLCSGYPYITLCLQVIESFSGTTKDNREPEVMPLFFRRYPASFSTKSLAHFGQELASGGRFQMFDYGIHENIIRYNSTTPPEYDLGKVKVPVYIIYGEADLLSNKEEVMPLFFRRYPASFSTKSLAHFGQELASGGRFQMFDYGIHENIIRYNSTTPPEYDLGKVKVPVYIIYGEADLLSNKEDAIRLYRNLQTEKYIKPFRGANDTIYFQHQDFFFSKYLIDFDRYVAQLIRDLYRKDKTNTNKNIYS